MRAEAPWVEVDGLRVTAAGGNAIVKDVSFAITRGEVVALIGESGSGKTTIGLALMGYARPGCQLAAGRIRIGATDVRALARPELPSFRGRAATYIAQSATAAFNPARRLMPQVIESALIHKLMPRAEAETNARALFAALALPDPEHIGDRFPHQVSGGQLQRLLAAMALITEPELVIFDEPTTALDVTTQIEVLRAFKNVVRQRRTTALYVSHDLAVVAQMADHIIVLRDGVVQEAAPTAQLLAAPSHPYTRSLLAAVAPVVRTGEVAPAPVPPPLLRIRGLTAGYGDLDAGGVTVLRDIELSIETESVLGVIGESGCGKSTLAQVIAGLLPPARGTIELDGKKLPPLARQRTRTELRRIQIVFQSADVALNPAHTVAHVLERPLRFYHAMRGAAARRRVAELLDLVRLPAALAARYPHELSGGQKQRVNLARALAAEPSLILCDEVTSALDSVVGAAILDLLAELRRELGLSYMFISHDLSTVRAICDKVLILYGGQMVELGGRDAMRRRPMHPYTDLLLSSVPELRIGWLDSISVTHRAEAAGGVAFHAATQPCAFFGRCAQRLPGVCNAKPPPLRSLSKGAVIRCHRGEQELLRAQAIPEPHEDFVP
jgi:peptide/nickel transport system ATP-binding protein